MCEKTSWAPVIPPRTCGHWSATALLAWPPSVSRAWCPHASLNLQNGIGVWCPRGSTTSWAWAAQGGPLTLSLLLSSGLPPALVGLGADRPPAGPAPASPWRWTALTLGGVTAEAADESGMAGRGLCCGDPMAGRLWARRGDTAAVGRPCTWAGWAAGREEQREQGEVSLQPAAWGPRPALPPTPLLSLQPQPQPQAGQGGLWAAGGPRPTRSREAASEAAADEALPSFSGL